MSNAVTSLDVWAVWVSLAGLLAVAAGHCTLQWRAAQRLRAEVRRLQPRAWLLHLAADLWALSYGSRAVIQGLLFAITVSRLWAIGWPPQPGLMLDASLLGAVAVDGVLLVLLTWTLLEARLLRVLERR